MIKKIKRFFYNIFYGLPFGMKAANDEMFSQKSSSNTDNIGVHEVVQKDSLGRDLLKGEVTQQVEELRYRTYKVCSESEKYEYLGDGIALKKDDKEENNLINFKQDNRTLCADVLTELNRVDKDYGDDKYTLSILYDSIPRFKLEKYCKEFIINGNKTSIETVPNPIKITLNFSKYGDEYDRSTYAFINEIKAIIKGKRSEFKTLTSLSFVTYKANNEDDLIQYDLYNLLLTEIEEKESYYSLIYVCNYFRRTNLSDKFYSESMDKKYKDKEKKDISLDLNDTKRVRFCSECGKRISVYDGDITQETYGYPLCQDCIKKILDNIE